LGVGDRSNFQIASQAIESLISNAEYFFPGGEGRLLLVAAVEMWYLPMWLEFNNFIYFLILKQLLSYRLATVYVQCCSSRVLAARYDAVWSSCVRCLWLWEDCLCI